MPVAQPFLLDGRWVAEGQPLAIRSPWDQSVVGEVAVASRQQLEQAIDSAVPAFSVTRAMPSHQRHDILKKAAAAISAGKEEFATLIAREAGKPIRAARAEVDRAIFTFETAAEEARRLNGEYLPLDLQPSSNGRWAIVRRFAAGPVAAITPFNFPLNLVAHKLAPAIAAGCSVVLKPAPQTPFSALKLARVLQESGLPDGALNVVPLKNEDAEALVTSDKLAVLSFTGSAAVGWQLKAKAGKKRVLLELGGNAAVIVHGDADVADAALRCVSGGFTYAGQSCISVQRIYVQRSVFDAFLQKLLEGVAKLKSGDPLDETTDVGPMIRETDAMRAQSWIDEAVDGGARLLAGGKRNGSMLEPTVLTGTRPEMKVNAEEAFAPLIVVEPYEEFPEAIARVNSSRYGLQAGVFVRDAALLFQAYEQLEVGGVVAGDVPTFRIDHMPYGGVKDSGLGREGIRYAIEEMTERKILVMNVR